RSGGFWPQGNGASHSGSIINLSAGGVLILSDSTLEEGTILLLKMSLQDIEVIDNVIGMVKRVDADENAWLLGVEFITVEYLDDIFSRSELDTLPGSIASFDEQVKKTLNKYVYYKKVSREEY
ncbi:MAG: PilZ domain-containing protein, partial [candidate division Zixibacteria bacterium]|nr:PilZ domain-containing protein [candidate division Zixibacteria bacterium]